MASSPALIADFGGVLTTSPLDSFNQWCHANGVSFGELLKALSEGTDGPSSSPLTLIETGAIDEGAFSAMLSEALERVGKTVPSSGLKEALFAGVGPQPEMVDIIKRIRMAGVPTCLLSNSWGRADYPYDVLEDLFDAMIFSGEVGMRKPEPPIYLMAAERLGRRPSDCVFVDDLKVNVKGAEAVGMKGILHTDVDGTVAKLETHFAEALHPSTS